MASLYTSSFPHGSVIKACSLWFLFCHSLLSTVSSMASTLECFVKAGLAKSLKGYFEAKHLRRGNKEQPNNNKDFFFLIFTFSVLVLTHSLPIPDIYRAACISHKCLFTPLIVPTSVNGTTVCPVELEISVSLLTSFLNPPHTQAHLHFL